MPNITAGWRLSFTLDGSERSKIIDTDGRVLCEVVGATHKETCMMRLAECMLELLKRHQQDNISIAGFAAIRDGIINVCVDGQGGSIQIPG